MEILNVVSAARAALTRKQAWPLFLTIATIVIVGVMCATTFRDYGIGWDGHVQDVYGQKLLSYYLTGFRDQSAFTYSNLRFYGGFFDLVAAAVNRLSPAGEFETRHLLGGVVFLIGLLGAWRLTRLIAGERAAAIAVVCLAAAPSLYGHAFINPKDSPFAWLLTWVTYFACRILDRNQRTSAPTYVGFAVFLGCAIGTKVFAAAYVVYLVGFVCAAALFERWYDRSPVDVGKDIAVLKPLLWAIPVTLLITAVFWPWAIQEPRNFFQSIGMFLRFPHDVPVLWEGAKFPSAKPPLSYLVVLLGLKLPEYALVGLALAAFFGLRHLRRQGLACLMDTHVRQRLFVAATALVPVLAFIVIRPTVYNGLRQYLFVVPPLIILGAIGLDQALTAMSEHWQRAGLAFAALLTFAVAREAVIMHRLHPYEYVAFNALAGGTAEAAQKFELDYWGTSLGEAGRDLERVLASSKTNALATAHQPEVFVCGDLTSAQYFMPRNAKFTTKIDEADFLMEPDTAVCDMVIHRPGKTIVEIKRDGAVLSRILDLRRHVQKATAPAGAQTAHARTG